MKNRPAESFSRALYFLALTFALSQPIAAQSPRPRAEVDPARTRFEDNSRREMQLRGLGGNTKSNDPKQVEAIVAQVKQDFERRGGFFVRLLRGANLAQRRVGVGQRGAVLALGGGWIAGALKGFGGGVMLAHAVAGRLRAGHQQQQKKRQRPHN